MDQVASWNEGDLEGYMAGYWDSDSLVFIGKSSVTYGWEETFANYQKKYLLKDGLGRLSLTIVKSDPLNEEYWSVVGQWHLVKDEESRQGFFTLLFRKFDDEWFIIMDHSS
ncbi:MAG: DUF4440 domain-containing protein [Bacteroidota bacterium]